jgi:SET domain-containing protein
MKSYISPKIKKEKDNFGGYGLFVVEKISKGELVIDFSEAPGKHINTEQTQEFYGKGEDYMIQVDDDLFFAATNQEELEDSDFLNHSCDANCGIKDKLKIVAMRDIEPSEEICFDYAMSESDPEYQMKCECGSKICRGKVTGNDWKIKDLQKRYKGFFSDYIQKKIDNLAK